MSDEVKRRQAMSWQVIGILISIVCIGSLARRVDVAQSLQSLTRLNGYLLPIPLAVFLVAIPLRALRWHTTFPAESRPGVPSCLSALGIGNMTNFLLPWRAGDVARCVLVCRGTAPTSLADLSLVLATLGVEKTLDGLALVGMVLLTVSTLSPPAWIVRLLWAASLIFGGALVAMVVLRHRAASLIAVGTALLRRAGLSSLADRVRGPLTSFSEGLAAMSSRGQLLRLVVMTGAIWFTEALIVWGLARSFGVDLSVRSAGLVSAVLALGLMVPAAPGGFGTYEVAGVAGMQLVGVDASSALALTLVIHAWSFITNVGLGLCLVAAGQRLPLGGEGTKMTADPDWSSRASAPARRGA